VFKNCPKKQTKNIFFTYYVTLLHKINNQFALNIYKYDFKFYLNIYIDFITLMKNFENISIIFIVISLFTIFPAILII